MNLYRIGGGIGGINGGISGREGDSANSPYVKNIREEFGGYLTPKRFGGLAAETTFPHSRLQIVAKATFRGRHAPV